MKSKNNEKYKSYQKRSSSFDTETSLLFHQFFKDRFWLRLLTLRRQFSAPSPWVLLPVHCWRLGASIHLPRGRSLHRESYLIRRCKTCCGKTGRMLLRLFFVCNCLHANDLSRWIRILNGFCQVQYVAEIISWMSLYFGTLWTFSERGICYYNGAFSMRGLSHIC